MTPPTKFSPGTRAFTLIEMMISMAMLSMVIGVVFAGVSGAQRATLFAANYPLGQMHLADFISMDAARGATIQATAGGVASTLPLTLTVPDIYGPGQIAQAPVRTAITEEKVKGKKFTSWQSLTRKWTLSYGGTPKTIVYLQRGQEIIRREVGGRDLVVATGVKSVTFDPIIYDGSAAGFLLTARVEFLASKTNKAASPVGNKVTVSALLRGVLYGG